MSTEDKRPTIPGINHDLKLEPPSWEHETFSWDQQPGSVVRSFRVEAQGTKYDLTITQREFVSTMLEQSQGKRDSQGGGDYDRAFTVTVWGAYHNGMWDSPSVGRSYRWREGDHIHGSSFAHKMGLDASDANAILNVLSIAGHSVSCIEVEVSYG